MQIIEHEIMAWITGTLSLILLFFAISTLTSYIKQKNKGALYLGLNYICFILGMLFFLIGHLNSIFSSMTTDFYYQSSMFANVFLVTGMLMILLFHNQFTEVSKIRRYIMTIAGIGLIIWILLPFNYIVTTDGGFQLKFVTYAYMTVYGGIIYVWLTVSFFKLSRKTLQKRNELSALGFGSLLLFIYFVVMTLYGITQLFLIMFISMILVFCAFLSYFIGIYLPKLRSSD